jgi:hypothetical protein
MKSEGSAAHTELRAAAVSERMIVLKRIKLLLEAKYGTLEDLERKIQTEGLSPDDHTRYTDLLEWRAANHESSELFHILQK